MLKPRPAAVGLAAGLVLAAAAPAPWASAAAPAQPPRAVVVILPSLDWPEFAAALRSGAMPRTRALAEQGAVGLLNVQTGGRLTPDDAYVTLGAGARAAGGRAAGEALGQGESLDGVPAPSVYRARTGQSAPAAAVLHLGISAIAAANAELDHPAVPGLLGETLRAAGRPTAVFGNADAAPPAAGGPPAPVLGRFAAAVAMDRRGAVEGGTVGPAALAWDPSQPGGWRTDVDGLAAQLARAAASGFGLAVVETGDLWRLENQRDRMAPAAYVAARQAALARADRLIGAVSRTLDPRRDLLLILSPLPSADARLQGLALAPAAAWGRGFGPGLLTSATTRFPCVATNTDVAPAILALHGLEPPPAMSGRPLAWSPARGDLAARLETVDGLYRDVAANHLRRPLLIKAYIFFAVAVLALAGAALARRIPAPGLLEPCLLALTAIPLAYLALALWQSATPASSLAAAAGITALLTAAALPLRRLGWTAPFTAVAMATVAAVAMDALLGLGLMSRSPLGHSLVGGARFYGIGNEYMGVMVGAALMAGAALVDARPSPGTRLAVLAGWAALTLLLAHPEGGANLGGTITAAAAFGITGVRFFRPRLRPRDAALVAAAALLILATVAAYDFASPPESQSHIARAVTAVADGGWAALAQIAERKLAMNWKLIRWTNWSILFLTSLALYTWFCLRPPHAVRQTLGARPFLALGFGGVALAAIVALACNDSGIVAAATAMIPATAPLLRMVAEALDRAGPG